MKLEQLLSPENVSVRLRAANKAGILAEVSKRAAKTLELSADAIASALRRREELGSTGMGQGAALPHARLADINTPFSMLLTLKSPIDFDSVDEQPVDLIFALLLPTRFEAEHLNALALAARRFRDPVVAASLRKSRDAEELFAIFIGNHTS